MRNNRIYIDVFLAYVAGYCLLFERRIIAPPHSPARGLYEFQEQTGAPPPSATVSIALSYATVKVILTNLPESP